MKTKIFNLFVFILILAFQKANARIWRVNNNGFTANFTSLQAANNDSNVISGDTIHLEGSSRVYSGTTITKKLVIIGPGFFLYENPNTSNNSNEAQITGVNFNIGSNGSQIIGVYISGGASGIGIINGISVSASDITIKRCRFDDVLYVGDNISSIKIIQNFFSFTGYSTTLLLTSDFAFPTDLIFNNNICKRPLVINNDSYTLQECNNNVFDCPTVNNGPSLKLHAGTFNDNIFTNPNATASINGGNVTHVDYNISASANNQFGIANHNIVVSDMSTLLYGAIGSSPDGMYQLKLNSAGSNNGSDGADRGAFGGASVHNRYTLSGLPPIPVVYNIVTPAVATPAGLQVTINARTIK